jgi:hypothetical protein
MTNLNAVLTVSDAVDKIVSHLCQYQQLKHHSIFQSPFFPYKLRQSVKSNHC